MARPVIHDNDGHVDDLLSTVALWLSPVVDLQAVTITNGDCFATQAFQAVLKMATYLGLEGAEVALNEDPVPNAFPDNWRKESYIINELPIFNSSFRPLYQQGRGRDSRAVLSDCLSHSKEPFTIVTTGPLTNIAAVIADSPHLADNIEECVIMGGAISVPGNVEEEESDGSAEWNIYADPAAARQILETGRRLTMVPLNVTNKLPVTKEFLARLEKQAETKRAARLAFTLWSLVRGFNYYFWDTVTAACVIDPNLFRFQEMRIDISLQGPSQGRTHTVLLGGRKVRVATAVDREAFEQLLLNLFSSR